MEQWRNDLYLSHHGILGMKWGKQNGPPYPLGSDDHSASEKKAGWRTSLRKSSKNRSDVKKSFRQKRLMKAANAAQRDADNLRKNGFKEEADAVQKVADRNREKANSPGIKLTDKQKKALKIGGIALGSALAIAGGIAVSKVAKQKLYEVGLHKIAKHLYSYNGINYWDANPYNDHAGKALREKFAKDRYNDFINMYSRVSQRAIPEKNITRAALVSDKNMWKYMYGLRGRNNPNLYNMIYK